MQSESAQAQLARWGISEEIANAAGLFDVPDVAAVFPEMAHNPGIIIPYYDIGGQLKTMNFGTERKPFGRVRWLDMPEPVGFSKRKPVRYTQPSHTGPQVYFPPLVDWTQIAGDPREPIIITEGEAKALAGAMHGFRVLALGGVFSFTTAGGLLLPDLELITWEQRDVLIVFDSDAATNPNVATAEARLVDELQGKRNAHVRVVRLPSDDGNKVGMDDYLKARGPDAFENLLTSAPPLSSLDAKIIALNRRVAWIEKEGLVWDIEAHEFIKKDHFVKGSWASAEKHVTVAGQRGKQTEISVAEKWLTHRHAQRYQETLFRPGEGIQVETDYGRPALNMWTGFDHMAPGDVTPWLRINEYIFKKLPEELRDWPLKLMAYKAQHPEVKIPLAIVLVGPEGSGKTMWMEGLREAFGPYGKTVSPSGLDSEFHGWLERGLFHPVYDMTPETMSRASEQIKTLISDLRQPMNDKFRQVRDVNAYGLYVFAANKRGVGSTAYGDRRKFIVDCPPHSEGEQMYVDFDTWIKSGGGRHLIHYLVNYDLKGWKPPQTAPMTSEKANAASEAMTPIQKLANEMRTADYNVVVRWLDSAAAWAASMELGNNPTAAQRARDLNVGLQRWQIRPWYTPEELTLMFPALVEMMYGSKFARTTPAGQISRELRECGINYLENKDDPMGFTHMGQQRQYLVIADFDDWSQPISQDYFEQCMKNWPTYGQIKRSRK